MRAPPPAEIANLFGEQSGGPQKSAVLSRRRAFLSPLLHGCVCVSGVACFIYPPRPVSAPGRQRLLVAFDFWGVNAAYLLRLLNQAVCLRARVSGGLGGVLGDRFMFWVGC